MKVCLPLFACVFVYVQTLQAQTDSTQVIVDSARYDFIILDARYQNQFSFWGRNFGQSIPFSSGSVAYYFHSNFWLGVSGFFFFDQNIPAQGGFNLGYYKELSQKIDWHISYSQFYISTDAIPLSSRTQGYLQTTFGADWGLLFSTIQPQILINKNSDIFITTQHSRYFVFNKKLLRIIEVSFEPKFSFTFGTHHFDYADAWVVGPTGGTVVQQSETTDWGGKIKPLNWDFTFPLKFAAGKFSLEGAWKYTSPLNTASSDPSKSLHIFSVALNYFISIKK